MSLKKRKNSKGKVKIKIFFASLALLILFIVVSTAYAFSAYQPELTTQVYDRNGKLMLEIYGDQKREYVTIDKIPESLQNATVATEDKNFYHHLGIDPKAIIRAAKSTFLENNMQGGSTITQQYVRNAYLSRERTYKRKIKEIIISLYIERFTPKNQILEKYLNEVAYGGVNYGVQAASKYYFGKSVSEITLGESVFLASLPKEPSKFASKEDMDMAEIKKIQADILTKMQEQKYITNQEKEEAQSQELKFTFTNPAFEAPHFTLMVENELISKYGEDAVKNGGLKVKTTLDADIQEKAEKIVADEVAGLKRLNVGNGAALIADPKTGEILAMVGSKDFFDKNGGSFNAITQAIRQPGSSIKPIMYAAAFEKGYTPATVLFDTPTTFYNQWEKYTPVNYDRRFHGTVSVRTALGNSYNIPAIRMLAAIGVDDFIKEASAMGIETLEKNGMGLSLTVGGGGVRMIELAQAYEVLANKGEKKDLFSISEIEDSTGKILFKKEDLAGTKIIDERNAYLLSDIMADNDARKFAFGPESLLKIRDHKVAVKTGTSDDKRDNWAIGYNPDYLVLAWVGNNDNSPMNQALSSGITGATPIWHNITKELLAGKPDKWYETPSGIVQKEIDISSGKLACKSTSKKIEYFLAGTEPKECANYKLVLIQKEESGKENIVREITKDEKIAPVDPKLEVKYISAIKDPLMEKTGQRSMIPFT